MCKGLSASTSLLTVVIVDFLVLATLVTVKYDLIVIMTHFCLFSLAFE